MIGCRVKVVRIRQIFPTVSLEATICVSGMPAKIMSQNDQVKCISWLIIGRFLVCLTTATFLDSPSITATCRFSGQCCSLLPLALDKLRRCDTPRFMRLCCAILAGNTFDGYARANTKRETEMNQR